MSLSQRLATGAALCAAVAAAAGLFVPDLYRDPVPTIAQGRGLDAATLVVAVPVLLVALVRSAAGSRVARLVVIGALGHLLYTYAQYTFTVVVNAASLLYIAVFALAAWALALEIAGLDLPHLASALRALPRRTTASFLGLIAVAFAGLWLSQIAGAVTSGALPAALVEAALPTNPIWTLDLGFVLPLCALTAVGLLRHDARASAAAVALLVFSALLGASLVSMSLSVGRAGQPTEPVLIGAFAAIAAVAMPLLALTLLGGRARLAH